MSSLLDLSFQSSVQHHTRLACCVHFVALHSPQSFIQISSCMPLHCLLRTSSGQKAIAILDREASLPRQMRQVAAIISGYQYRALTRSPRSRSARGRLTPKFCVALPAPSLKAPLRFIPEAEFQLSRSYSTVVPAPISSLRSRSTALHFNRQIHPHPPRRQPHFLLLAHVHTRVVSFHERDVHALRF